MELDAVEVLIKPTFRFMPHQPGGSRHYYLYLMATVSDGTGSKLVCRIGDYRGFHGDIAYELQEELANFTVSFQGGGTLLFQLGDTNSIRIGDSSDDYGPDQDPNQTRELLQAAFPDYRIEICGEF